MTNFYRAMCAELVDALAEWRLGGGPPEDTADADLIALPPLLDQPVAEGPSDEEIMELMPQEMRDDLAAAARARRPTPQPKPPSLKEQALEQLRRVNAVLQFQATGGETSVIRRALESLDDNDYRAICAELHTAIQLYTGQNPAAANVSPSELVCRLMDAMAASAAALDQPVAEGPTDEELWAVGNDDFRANCYPTDAIAYARAVLAKWGRQ